MSKEVTPCSPEWRAALRRNYENAHPMYHLKVRVDEYAMLEMLERIATEDCWHIEGCQVRCDGCGARFYQTASADVFADRANAIHGIRHLEHSPDCSRAILKGWPRETP